MPKKLEGLRARLTMPGDKSITHRAVILAALARGAGRIEGANLGADVVALCDAMAALGPRIEIDEEREAIVVDGSGWPGLREPEAELDLGNSGTALRLLAGVCAAVEGLFVLTGDASLRRRPMLRVVAPLRQMGARIDGREHGDRAPLTIRGGELTGIDIATGVASAQVKTALLLAGLRASGRTVVTEPGPSRDHTERMLAAAGIPLERSGHAVAIPGGGLEPTARDWHVPGDVSSALFFVVAALVTPGSEIVLDGVGLNPTRTAALDVLRRMGGSIQVDVLEERGGEPVGTLVARSSELAATVIEPAEVPALIDEIPILCLAATQAQGVTEIRGAGELRVKESDRIEGIASVLGALGGGVTATSDGLSVEGPTPLRGGEVDPRDDHRLAMTAAVAGLLTPEKVRVRNWSVVDTSFPGFADILAATQGSPRRRSR